jgi:transcriptional regulator with XRE-family HTH domain
VSDVPQSAHLADAIKARRLEKGWDIQRFVDETGITRQGLQPLLRGEVRNYQDRLTLAVTKALDWTPDSIERLMRGEPPERTNGPDNPSEALIAEVADLRMRLVDLQALADEAMPAIEELTRRVVRLEAAGGQTAVQ